MRGGSEREMEKSGSGVGARGENQGGDGGFEMERSSCNMFPLGSAPLTNELPL